MKIRASSLGVLTAVVCFLSTLAQAAPSQTMQVRGSIQEQFIPFAVTSHGVIVDAKDTWTGSLVGDRTLHIFSSDIIDLTNGIEANVISARMLFTSQENLFLNELGARNGDSVSVVSDSCAWNRDIQERHGATSAAGVTHQHRGPIHLQWQYHAGSLEPRAVA